MQAQELATALGGKKVGDGRYIAPCPAHDDKNPSLSIKEPTEKQLLNPLINCWAGCSRFAVISKLKSLGLWAFPQHQTNLHTQKKQILSDIDLYSLTHDFAIYCNTFKADPTSFTLDQIRNFADTAHELRGFSAKKYYATLKQLTGKSIDELNSLL